MENLPVSPVAFTNEELLVIHTRLKDFYRTTQANLDKGRMLVEMDMPHIGKTVVAVPISPEAIQALRESRFYTLGIELLDRLDPVASFIAEEDESVRQLLDELK